MADDRELPKLPEPQLKTIGRDAFGLLVKTPGSRFTADQMRDYAHAAISKLTQERDELHRQNRILEVKNASTLANNLCPDHRDKQVGRPCLACTIETLTRERDELRRDLLKAQGAWAARQSAARENARAALNTPQAGEQA